MWPSFSPLGYQNVVGASGKKIMIPDPVLGPVVKRLFERYATGKYSLKEVAVLARADGLVYRKSGDPVPTSTVHKILRNRTYSGDFDYNGTVYHGAYEPLVSQELWDEVQAVLDGRRAKRPKMHEFTYSELMNCGHCGCAMVGEIKKGRYTTTAPATGENAPRRTRGRRFWKRRLPDCWRSCRSAPRSWRM